MGTAMKFQITVQVGSNSRVLIAAEAIAWMPHKPVLSCWSKGQYHEIPAHVIEEIDYIVNEETCGTWPTIEPPMTASDIVIMCLDAERFANGGF